MRQQAEIDRRLIALDGSGEQKPIRGQRPARRVSGRRRLAAQLSQLPLYRYLGGIGANLLPVPCMNIINGGVRPLAKGRTFRSL